MRAALTLVILAFASSAGCAQSPQTAATRTMPLPDVTGRIDHFAYDAAHQRLFVAALGNGSLEVIDLQKGARIKSIAGLKEPQGVAYLAATNEFYVASGGDGTVRAYDAATFAPQNVVTVGDDADNLRVTPDGKSLIVGFGSGALAFLDPATLAKRSEVSLSGHPESFQIEPDGKRIFVNIPGGVIGGGGNIAVVDVAKNAVTATWPLKDAGRNFPMALDAEHQRLYIGCRRPAQLIVLDTSSGAVVAALDCIGDADDLFVNAVHGDNAAGGGSGGAANENRADVYVIGGDGGVDVFTTSDFAHYTKQSRIETKSGARTGLFVAPRNALYVAVPRSLSAAAEIREFALHNPTATSAPSRR